MKKRKTPAIRFKGFTDDWEQQELRNNIISISDNRGKNPPYYTKKGIPIIDNFLIKNNLYPDLNTATRFIDEYIYLNFIRDYPKFNDILITMVGNGIGNITLFPKEKSIIIQNTLGLRFRDNDIFIFYNLISNNKKILDLNRGMAQPSIRQDELLQLTIKLPNIYEQQQIGEFFSKLDNLITFHQRKYEKLQILKKAMLEKMFPKNGAKIPEIRFKGFNDDWEQQELGKYTEITMGQSPDGNTYSPYPTKYILVQGNADFKNGWVNPRIWTTQLTKKANSGDLIMSVRAPAGTVGKTSYDVVIGRGVAAIKGNEFIFQSLLKKHENNYWTKISCGSTFDSLNSNDIKTSELLLPSQFEQQQIGAVLSKLDNLITLHQRKIEKLQTIKKAMLEKMFI